MSTAKGFVRRALEAAALLAVFVWAAYAAYHIRLYAIETYGRVIHEFDPWFNFRATQYLAKNGLSKFFKWYDYMSWYPLGRPVGTTIYPGMQITSVIIWNVLNWEGWKGLMGKEFAAQIAMSLNDVCVFVPAWFGSIASVVLGLLAREVSGSWRAGAASALVMAVVPAHIMRSVGGGYDNESVAMTAMCLTFYLWCRSLRTPSSWWIGVLAGLAYAYMVAAWGGFIFVGNMVAIHAAVLVALGYYSSALHKAYTLWYIVGTALAIQVPVVGMSPFKSAEQIGLLLVFFGLHYMALCEELARRKGLTWADQSHWTDIIRLRAKTAGVLAGIAVVPLAILIPTGYFGPLSVRVRSLFIKHTKTGNPLVDSVAEHQPGSTEAYIHYLHYAAYLAPIGLALVLAAGMRAPKREYSGVQVNKWFIALYAVVAYYFASKMQRLIILLGPVASVLAGVAIAAILSWAVNQFLALATGEAFTSTTTPASTAAVGDASITAEAAGGSPAGKAATGTGASGSKAAAKKARAAAVDLDAEHPLSAYGMRAIVPTIRAVTAWYATTPARVLRLLLAAAVLVGAWRGGLTFSAFSHKFARDMSQPTIMYKARLNTGEEIMIDDYREAYHWLRDHTPKDSRVLSWWDYGYQISGIAKRTCLADGNTWNLEHIALLGRILVSPQKKAHSLARHLADYVLIWAGNQQGTDLAKSTHMARIGSSVYPDICPGDPLCRGFGFYAEQKPSPSMANSMLYKMHQHGLDPAISVDPKYFTEAFRSKYGLVRIFKIQNISEESKTWLADPANRICDAPGSWYCTGQYPPNFPKPPTTHRNVDYDDANRYREEQEQ